MFGKAKTRWVLAGNYSGFGFEFDWSLIAKFDSRLKALKSRRHLIKELSRDPSKYIVVSEKVWKQYKELRKAVEAL